MKPVISDRSGGSALRRDVHEASEADGELKGRKRTMERESKGCTTVILYMFVFINVDVWKQVTTYGIKYYNGGTYPIPQTLVVAVTEFAKLVVFLGVAARDGTLSKIKLSIIYAVPSIIYAANNNIFFFALHYTTPPIWNILIQMRIVVAALAYRVIFKKTIRPIQWAGLGLLIAAIVMTELSGEDVGSVQYKDLTIPLLLAVIGSITSTSASFLMEYLFKTDNRTFTEMQVQLYLFGTLGCSALYAVESGLEPAMPEVQNEGSPWITWLLLFACIFMSVVTGFTVALIVKRLDNIVKLYTQALANTMTSIACSFLFPADFHLSLHFFVCLLMMVVAIFLYESKGIS